jgi:hypothetical protein
LLQPFADYAPGPIARSYSDLESSLELWISGDDSWSARRQQLRELMVPASTRSAAEALLAELQI